MYYWWLNAAALEPAPCQPDKLATRPVTTNGNAMSTSISIDGTRFAYQMSGRGPCVVCLHGWMCNMGFWRAQQDRLVSGGYRSLTLDFRGHGASEMTRCGYSIEQLATDVWHILEALKIDQGVMVGHSMGGMVAQQFCLDHPAWASGLVLVTTTAQDAEDRMISKRIAADAPTSGFGTAFDRHFPDWFPGSVDPAVMSRVRQQMLQTPEHVALELVRSYRHFDLTNRLGQIDAPALAIGSLLDRSTAPGASRHLADTIRHGQLLLIEDCGHFPMVEKPDRLSQAMLAFVRQTVGFGKD